VAGLGFASPDDFRQGFVGAYFAPMDPNNLIAQAQKWRGGDIGGHAGGDVTAALGAIAARFFVAPFSEDLFFPPEDCRADAAAMPKGEYRPVTTSEGECAT
jgi:homoserine O-acetyltransferase/O-succinyltransferase